MSLTRPLQQLDRTFVRSQGRKLIYFGGCDYFRLASHPDVLRALQEGARKFGLNVAASRSTTGNHVLFGALEKALARFFGSSAALFSNGYVTNLAFTQTFADAFTHAFIDERSHGSLRDAAAVLRCPVRSFRHRDVDDLEKSLRRLSGSARPLILTDGLFSHNGSVAPLKSYLSLLGRDGMLLLDDAHAAGILGRQGKGTPELGGVRDERIVQTVSLSKAFGVYGGAVVGPAKVISAIQERSRVFNGNTPLPLPLANAALKAVRLVRETPALRTRLQANTSRIKKKLLRAGFPVLDNTSPIVAVTPGDAAQTSRLSQELLRAGIFPPLIHYASVPPHGYFRFAISSEHTAAQLDGLAEVLVQANGQVRT